MNAPAPPFIDFSAMYSPSQAARAIGISNSTIHLWLKLGKAIALPTPCGNLFTKAEVERLRAEYEARTQRAES